MTDGLYILIFLLGGMAFPIGSILVARLLSPSYPEPSKVSTYESGEVPFGEARVQFHLGYYAYALVFLIFDIEAIFLYPWAVIYKDLGLFGFVEMLIFILILVVGLVYALKKRVLEWM